MKWNDDMLQWYMKNSNMSIANNDLMKENIVIDIRIGETLCQESQQKRTV